MLLKSLYKYRLLDELYVEGSARAEPQRWTLALAEVWRSTRQVFAWFAAQSSSLRGGSCILARQELSKPHTYDTSSSHPLPKSPRLPLVFDSL